MDLSTFTPHNLRILRVYLKEWLDRQLPAPAPSATYHRPMKSIRRTAAGGSEVFTPALEAVLVLDSELKFWKTNPPMRYVLESSDGMVTVTALQIDGPVEVGHGAMQMALNHWYRIAGTAAPQHERLDHDGLALFTFNLEELRRCVIAA